MEATKIEDAVRESAETPPARLPVNFTREESRVIEMIYKQAISNRKVRELSRSLK
jgi:hypothetical protein